MAGKRCIISLPRSARKWLFPGLGAAVLLIFLAVWLMGRTPALPEADQRLKDAASSLPRYDVMLRLNPQAHTLAISQQLDYSNATPDTLSSLVLRTWLNAYETEESSPAATEELYDVCYYEGFSPGYLTLQEITWNGKAAAWRYLDKEKTVLEIDVDPLPPGEGGVLSLRAIAEIPACAHRTGYTENAYQLSHVLPLLSRYEEGAWRQDAYCPVGDPFVNDCANFSIRVYAPDDYLPVCSAPLERQQDGSWQGEILAAREIGLCIGKGYYQQKALHQGTLICSYARNQAGAKRALEDAKKAIETFSVLYGDYPWPSFTVCSADFPFGGIEYTAFCLASEDYYLESQADTLELIIAHEAAHQWFYALVGSDQWYQPWQDEALCEYATLRYVEKRYGQGSFNTLKFYRVDSPMQEVIPGSLTPGSPIDYFGNLTDYSAVVYGRGAALMIALDEMLPQGADDFLRAYAEKFAFGFADRQAFESFLQEYSGMDLAPLLLDYLDTIMMGENTNERVIA